jgi:hypothetical protein
MLERRCSGGRGKRMQHPKGGRRGSGLAPRCCYQADPGSFDRMSGAGYLAPYNYLANHKLVLRTMGRFLMGLEALLDRQQRDETPAG